MHVASHAAHAVPLAYLPSGVQSATHDIVPEGLTWSGLGLGLGLGLGFGLGLGLGLGLQLEGQPNPNPTLTMLPAGRTLSAKGWLVAHAVH